MFCDEDDAKHRSNGAVNSDMDSLSSGNPDDDFDDDDDSSEEYDTEDGFMGWTDEEILKARYTASIAKELEQLSTKENKN